MSSFKAKTYNVVESIPAGTVASYGDIAALADKPRAARLVGQIAKRSSMNLPWHRVVKSDGTLAAGFVWGGADKQQKMLEAEGVEFESPGVISNFEQYRIEL